MTKPTADSELLDEYYRELADDYNRFLRYSPGFVRTLTTVMIEKLQLGIENILADIGCGTGMYSLDILEQVQLRHPILGADPYPEMLAAIPDDANIIPIEVDALTFSRQDRQYDKVLVKESIHHVDDRPQFFANIHSRLDDGGRMLLVHVPPRVDYPLFTKALDRCLTWHADPEELEVELAEAGFIVERDAVEYEHRLPTDHYMMMVENCYMSVLTSFSDDELRAGLAEMEDKYGDRDELRFTDHFDYLTAVR